MSITKINAIVLDSFDYEEAGKVVTVFSDKFGKISFIALGVNKAISKNKYSLLTFSKSEFEIFRSRKFNGLSKLKTGNIIKSNLNISKSYDNYLYASAISKIVLQVATDQEKQYGLYSLIDKALNIINDDDSPFTALSFFLYKSMKFFGGGWSINKCIRCNKKSKIYRFFSFNEYGVVCPNCWIEGEEVHSTQFMKFLSDLDMETFTELITQHVESTFIIVITKIILNYYKNVLGIVNKPLIEIENMKIFASDVINNYTHSVLTNHDLWV